MPWVFYAVLAPALWAATNHIGKYVLSRYFSNAYILTVNIFSACTMGVLVVVVGVAHRQALHAPPGLAAAAMGVGLIYAASLWPFRYLLRAEHETSRLVPLFQVIPVMTYFIGYFSLGERLAAHKLVAGAVVIAGAMLLSADLNGGRLRLKARVLGLMMLSSLLASVYFILFKMVALRLGFWTANFWQYLGWFLLGLGIFAGSPKRRADFWTVVRRTKGAVFGADVLSEAVNISGQLASNFASLLAPVALVQTLAGLQPFFVFVYGVALTVLAPHLVRESLARRDLAQKILAIVIIFGGTYLLLN